VAAACVTGWQCGSCLCDRVTVWQLPVCRGDCVAGACVPGWQCGSVAVAAAMHVCASASCCCGYTCVPVRVAAAMHVYASIVVVATLCASAGLVVATAPVWQVPVAAAMHVYASIVVAAATPVCRCQLLRPCMCMPV
jgi:hypothetical protein